MNRIQTEKKKILEEAKRIGRLITTDYCRLLWNENEFLWEQGCYNTRKRNNRKSAVDEIYNERFSVLGGLK